MTLYSEPTGLLAFFAQFLIVQLLQLFIYCWIGQSVENKMGAMTGAIYSAKWYLMMHNTRKNFVFVMMNANRRACMRVGKIVPLNFDMFAVLIKKLASVLSLFRAVIVNLEK